MGQGPRSLTFPDELEPLIKALKDIQVERDIQIYVVGGYVRDFILGIPRSEMDIVVEGASGPEIAESVAARLGLHRPVIFERFGTAQIRYSNYQIEFVTARTEEYPSKTSRKPVVAPADLFNDIMRRDFTINTLLASLDGEIIDLTGLALQHLQQKLIKTPRDPWSTFDEDPLRMLRAARFAAQLGFNVDDEVINAARDMAYRITEAVAVERIRIEFEKLVCSRYPALGFNILQKSGLLHYILPEFEACLGIGKGGYHDDDVYHHTLRAMELARPYLELRLACLLHDIAKPVTMTQEGNRIYFRNHHTVGAEMSVIILKRLRFSNSTIERVAKLVELHLRPVYYTDDWTDGAVRRLVRDAGEDIDLLLELADADIKASEYPDKEKIRRLRERINEINAREAVTLKPPLNGYELMQLYGKGPGPWIGHVQRKLMEALLDGTIKNDKQDAIRYLKEHPELEEVKSQSPRNDN